MHAILSRIAHFASDETGTTVEWVAYCGIAAAGAIAVGGFLFEGLGDAAGTIVTTITTGFTEGVDVGTDTPADPAGE